MFFYNPVITIANIRLLWHPDETKRQPVFEMSGFFYEYDNGWATSPISWSCTPRGTTAELVRVYSKEQRDKTLLCAILDRIREVPEEFSESGLDKELALAFVDYYSK